MYVSILKLILSASTLGATDFPCPVLLGGSEASAPRSWRGRAILAMPAPWRKARRRLFSSVARGDLEALHARVEAMVPFDLASPMLRATSAVYLEHFVERRDPKVRRQWQIDFAAAGELLEEILEVGRAVEGEESEEVGLTHFSLSVFHALASHRPATVREPRRPMILDMKLESNEFDRLALDHAERAYRILARAGSAFAPFARLQWVKRLQRAGHWLSCRDHFALVKPGPAEGYEEMMAVAERESASLLRDLRGYGLSEDGEAWLRVQAALVDIELRQTRAAVITHRTRDYRTRRYPTEYVALLRYVVDHPSLLPRLIADGRDGALYDLVNRTRWWFVWLEQKATSGPLYEIEEALRSEKGPTAEEFRSKIRHALNWST